MDCESSKSPREIRHSRRCFQSASRWILVGPSALAVSVGTVADEKMVSRFDPDAIHDLGQTSDSARPLFNCFRLFSVWLGRPFLDGRDPPRLLSSYAGFRQQPLAFEAGTCRRSRFQPKHRVAWPLSTHRLEKTGTAIIMQIPPPQASAAIGGK